jgi:hypothetical protein
MLATNIRLRNFIATLLQSIERFGDHEVVAHLRDFARRLRE